MKSIWSCYDEGLMQSQNVVESNLITGKLFDMAQDFRFPAEHWLVNATAHLHSDISTSLSAKRAIALSGCVMEVASYSLNRSRASHTVANAPKPSFCRMRYRGGGGLGPVGLAGPHLGQDLTKDDRVKSMFSIHANIFHIHLFAIDEEQLAVLAQVWLGPRRGSDIVFIINENGAGVCADTAIL